MPQMRQRKHREKWQKSSRTTAISLQRLGCVSRPRVPTSSEKKDKATILKACQERVSLRGIERIFSVARQQVTLWVREHVQTLPPIRTTLLPAEPDDVLEFDECWCFVLKKVNKRWLWPVMCRRTRQIVAFTIGDRSEKACRRLWGKMPVEYRCGTLYSDFWKAYQNVLPQEQHHAVGKESGQTNHMERWYCTLRQCLARYVRKTLSFSKSDAYHHMFTKWFIYDYNLAIKELSSLTL